MERTGATETLCQREFRYNGDDAERVNDSQNGGQVFEGSDMCVPYRIVVADGAAEDRAEIMRAVEGCFATVDEHLNNWNPSSEVSRVNACESTAAWHSLSPVLAEVLQEAAWLNAATDGLFDPTVSTPPPGSSSQGSPSSWAAGVELDVPRRRLRKRVAHVHIDLCAVSKGWLVDAVTHALAARFNFAETYVEWGGDLRVTGRWAIAVEKARPAPGAELLGDRIVVDTAAVATSGTYKRGKPVPPPGAALPAPGLAAATVVSQASCMRADGLATAAVLAGTPEAAAALLARVCGGAGGYVLQPDPSAAPPEAAVWHNVAAESRRAAGGPPPAKKAGIGHDGLSVACRDLLKTVPQHIVSLRVSSVSGGGGAGDGGLATVLSSFVPVYLPPAGGGEAPVFFFSVMHPSRLSKALQDAGGSGAAVRLGLHEAAPEVAAAVSRVERVGDHLAVWCRVPWQPGGGGGEAREKNGRNTVENSSRCGSSSSSSRSNNRGTNGKPSGQPRGDGGSENGSNGNDVSTNSIHARKGPFVAHLRQHGSYFHAPVAGMVDTRFVLYAAGAAAQRRVGGGLRLFSRSPVLLTFSLLSPGPAPAPAARLRLHLLDDGQRGVAEAGRPEAEVRKIAVRDSRPGAGGSFILPCEMGFIDAVVCHATDGVVFVRPVEAAAFDRPLECVLTDSYDPSLGFACSPPPSSAFERVTRTGELSELSFVPWLLSSVFVISGAFGLFLAWVVSPTMVASFAAEGVRSPRF
ncbi:FAD:protein FMN transferase [Diplonema papillatum]|nr:FAD:protein FMN transferase [Diplonema papillatum]